MGLSGFLKTFWWSYSEPKRLGTIFLVHKTGLNQQNQRIDMHNKNHKYSQFLSPLFHCLKLLIFRTEDFHSEVYFKESYENSMCSLKSFHKHWPPKLLRENRLISRLHRQEGYVFVFWCKSDTFVCGEYTMQSRQMWKIINPFFSNS